MQMIVTFALKWFLDIHNTPGLGLCIQPAFKHYVQLIIRTKTFQFLFLWFQSEIMIAAQQNHQISFKHRRVQQALPQCDEELHLSQAADVQQLLNQNDLNDLVGDLGLTKEKLELFFFTNKTMKYVAEKSQLLLFSFHTRKSSFSVQNGVCVIAATLIAFLKHWNLSIISMSGGCLLIQVKQA